MTKKKPTPIRLLRDSMSLTQTDFAECSGLAPGFVSQLECRRSDVGKEAALAILDAFRPEMERAGISLEMLLRGEM